MKALICAGGTGGGIYPALSAVTELRRLGLGPEDIRWVGTRGEMEETLVPRAGLQLESISGGAIIGVPAHVAAKNSIKLTAGIGDALRVMRQFRPSVVFMTGGYVAVPVTLAAWMRRVPISIYLPDVEPGSAIKFGLRFAEKVACTTDGSQKYVPANKMVVTGYPVRAEIRAAAQMCREEALALFDLKPHRKTLFVFGGSRGARSINRAVLGVLPQLLAKMQVIHVSGSATWPEVAANTEKLPESLREHYRPYEYLHEEMGAAFRSADLILSRAGASMLGEGPAFGVPSILVPYPHAWRYQKVNADYLSERGAAVQLKDEQLQDGLLGTVMALIEDEEKLALMSAAAKAIDIPDAAANLAQMIMAVGQRTAHEVSA